MKSKLWCFILGTVFVLNVRDAVDGIWSGYIFAGIFIILAAIEIFSDNQQIQ